MPKSARKPRMRFKLTPSRNCGNPACRNVVVTTFTTKIYCSTKCRVAAHRQAAKAAQAERDARAAKAQAAKGKRKGGAS